MNFKSLIKRDDNADSNVDTEFEELQTELADAFDECLGNLDEVTQLKDSDLTPLEDSDLTPLEDGDLAPLEDGSVSEGTVAAIEDGSQVEDNAFPPAVTRRLTSHTQSRLAALSSFDGLFHDAQEYLEEITAKLSEVAASHTFTRELFNILHADILRANELELANISLTTEQRVLSEQLHDANRKQREREGAVEALQQRETSLVQDREALRGALAAARLELVEAANTSAKSEAEFGELAKALSAKAVEANRRARENEMLREKHVSMSIDLDKAQKREAEARRRVDELSTIHANEAVRHSELLAALGRSEKEELRLQKSLESTQAKLSEMTEAARIMESDREAEVARSLAEMRGLRSEVQALQSRLELASNENSEVASEIAKLKVQWSDAVAEKQIADERLSALTKESETDKMNLSTVNANFSQLSLQQASEQNSARYAEAGMRGFAGRNCIARRSDQGAVTL